MIARLDFVKFLRADRFFLVQRLVAFEGRIGEGEIGFRRGDLLLGRQVRGRSAVESGTRLGVVNDGENLSTLDSVAFAHSYFDDVAHHLGGQLAGLSRADGSHRLNHIGNVRRLRGDYRNIAYDFWCRIDRLTFTRTADKGCR